MTVDLKLIDSYYTREHRSRAVAPAEVSGALAPVSALLPDITAVACFDGAGASLAAVLDGRSVDTTMGFTPLEGLFMATRSGTVDPGLVLWLEEHEHLTPHEVGTALEERSGLTALAGRYGRRRSTG